MPLYALKLDKDKSILDVIKKANYRLKGGDGSNHGLIFISGKISFTTYKNQIIIIFNIRPFISLPFFKSLFNYAFKRSLKKAGYKGAKPSQLSFRDFSKTLEGLL